MTIACFGEILWDCLPRGLFLGGAPINAAYHLSRHSVRAIPISAVGRDFLGDEARRRLTAWNLEARFVPRNSRLPTGIVRASLDARGAPTYQIIRDVAWDRIAPSRTLFQIAQPDAIVFGTLALRDAPNRHALTRLLAVWPDAMRVVDLNLRPPFDRRGPIAFVLRLAGFVKLNDLELGHLTGAPVKSPRALARAVRAFAHEHRLHRVCVTAGARGAGLWWDDSWFWEDARTVRVRDSVGAGDAFLGGLLAALLLRQATPAAALASACRMGEFVAARDGATPPYRCDATGRAVDAMPHAPLRKERR